MNSDPQHLVCMGQFGSTYAVQGWLKLQSFSDPDDGILSYQPWYTKEKQPLNIEQSRRHGRGFVVKVRGIDNPEMARALIGKEVFVPRDQLPELAPGEYYWADLLGLKVINRAGRQLGKVEEMMETGANDVLVVKPDQAGKANILIPYVMQRYIDSVDLAAQTIQVDWDWDEENE